MTATRREVRATVLRAADRVRKAVDRGAKRVEAMHKSIAAVPLEMLEGVDRFETRAKRMRRNQARRIGVIYTAIRRVNREVNGFAHDVLVAAPVRKAAPRRRPRSKRPAAAAKAPPVRVVARG
jgi:hypothetical protein